MASGISNQLDIGKAVLHVYNGPMLCYTELYGPDEGRASHWIVYKSRNIQDFDESIDMCMILTYLHM